MQRTTRRALHATASRLGRHDRHTPRIRRPSAARRPPGRRAAETQSAKRRRGPWTERAKFGEIERLLSAFNGEVSSLPALLGDSAALEAATHPTAQIEALREMDTDAMVLESVAWDGADDCDVDDDDDSVNVVDDDDAPPRAVDRFNLLIAAQGAQGRREAALRSWERMRLLGVAPNEETHRNLVLACARAGALDDAQRIFALACDEGATPSPATCAALVYAHVVADDVAGAASAIDALHEANAQLTATAYVIFRYTV